MLKIFQFLNRPMKLSSKSIEGSIVGINYASMEEIEKVYEEFRDKSIREGIYYIKGSNYMKETMEKYPNPDFFHEYFFRVFEKIDEREPLIPLEIGLRIEEMLKDKSIRLGMHRSYAIQNPNICEDEILQKILREGLINNGAAMQGLVTERVYPSQTVRCTDSPITALSVLKSSYRGSTGAVLVGLPRKLVDVNMDFVDSSGDDIIYRRDEMGVCYIKPEYILGYMDCRDGHFQFYSREELLRYQKEKEL